ncbi:MAG: alpha/beta hydrolase [Hyphomicrobiales bacterium]|nr:MAG: alpha/beta hydrolase [Hyphomicrobiales bacterium]
MSLAARSLMLLAFAPMLLPGAVSAQEKPQPVASGVAYELIGRWDVARLNTILEKDTPAFSGVAVTYTPAQTAVRLYRITYPTTIPERGNKPTIASGLLALPETAQAGAKLPMVSYQHGTVYGRQEVPSFPEQSPETQLMIAQFAGQGYALIGADYFGLGTSQEPEGYMVKASHQQATADMLTASRAVLAQIGIETPRLYLAGWSQGGFVTMAMLEKLEASGIAVNGAATASAPMDVYATLNGFLDFPRKNDAAWVQSLFMLSAFSFENYYGVPGLARSVLTDEAYDISRKIYERQPINAEDVPTDLHKVVRAEYFDPQFFANSAYGKLTKETQSYRWVIKSPVRNYYGEADEAISVGIGRLAMTYAQAMGAGNPRLEAISTGPTSHRGTFATAVPQWKAWFDAN